MRRAPTEPEKRFWRRVSRSQLRGWKFRRQVVIGPFIADFTCPAVRLVVEIDGDTHADPAADARRTLVLEGFGIRVARFTNADIMTNLDGVLERLVALLPASDVAERPHPNPSPEGEGLQG